jgi:hypothetical protein
MPAENGTAIESDPEAPRRSSKQPSKRSSKQSSNTSKQSSNPSSQRSSQRRQAPMKEEDNVSDVSDAEIDPNQEEEPRFKYSTADLNDSSPRNSTCCLVSMCLLCLVVAITLSVVLAKVFQNKEDENAKTPSPAPTGPNDGSFSLPGETSFNAPREGVESRCSTTSFKENQNQCETLCDRFDCCNPGLAKNESCFFGNREGCLNYARCHVTNFRIDPPPSNLRTICSPDRLAQERATCEAKCTEVACCWSDDASCVFDDFYACIDYAPCQNLRDDLQVPAAKLSVQDLCTEGGVSQGNACDEACAGAECCWSEGADNCLQSNFFTCATYNPCTELQYPDPGAVPLPSQNISEVCSLENINTGNTSSCETACSSGTCCLEGASDTCFTDDPMTCLQYDACKLLVA